MKRFELLFIVVALLLSGCASTEGTGKAYSQKQLKEMGEKYIAAGDTANALKSLTEAEQKKPGDPQIQYDLGLAYNQRALTDQAISHFQQALKLKPAYPEALNALGAIYADRGQIELAQDSFQKALNDPFYQTPQFAAYNLGRLYEKEGDTERALTLYEQAVKFDPAYGLAWYRIGTILETLRRGDEARNAYGKAVSSSPDLAEAHLRYGVMSYQAGNMEAAIFSLSRVVKLAPNTSMADEARPYLAKLKAVAQPEPRTGTSGSVSPTDIEVFSNQELQRQQMQQQLSPPRPAVKEQHAPLPKSTAPTVKMTPVPTPSETPPPASTEGFVPAPQEAVAPMLKSTAPTVKMTPVPTPSETPPPTSTEGFVPAPREAVAPMLKEVPAPAAADPSGAGFGQPPGIQEQQFNYIVQLGSFVDKEKAEDIKNHLHEKGYNAILKPLKHKVLGSVYVIQLKPVNSFSKASTLMTQLGTEVEGEPVIIKVPIASKPLDLTPPPNPTPAP